MLYKAARDNAISFRECESVIGLKKRNNEVGIVEKELIENKWLVKDLRASIEWARMKCDEFQSKCIFSESRHEELVKKLKCEVCRLMLVQQEEECLGAEGTTEKTGEEWKSEATVERHEQ